MENYGVIDLGTNTFHLLIARATESGALETVFRERRFIKLAEDGIEHIGAAAFERGLQAMQHFKHKLDEYEVEDVQAIGTAALRTADNGQDFIQKVAETTGIRTTLISGDREAELIHRGVMQAIPPVKERILIMDIGGGSVEFIIADAEQVCWASSFSVGVAILWKKFHHSDPITETEIRATHQFLTKALQPLQAALQRHPVRILVGASGTFDVLENILVRQKDHAHHSHMEASEFPAFYNQIIHTTLAERLAMQGMPAERADMIVVALILLNYVLVSAKIESVIISAFAMKEGVLAELMEA